MNKTIVYYSANREDPKFEQKIVDDMLSKRGDIPIISVTQKPMDLGTNICVGDVGASSVNCRRQVLMGCQLAKTEYIVAAESDSLYPPEYFHFEPDGYKKYRFNNVWIMYLKDKTMDKYYRKIGTYDGAQVIKRDYLMNLLKEYLKNYPEWQPTNDSKPRRNPYWMTARKYFSSKNPCITMKTGFGMHYTLRMDENPENAKESLPYFGNVNKLRKRLL